MSGWIKIHRKFLDWEWFNKSEAVHLFMYLVLKANHKDGQWQGIDIKKGQFVTSFGKISADTGISLQTIRTLLKKFENTNEINIQTTNKFTIVTICKYECYQEENEQTNKQVTNKQQTINKQLTTNKNDKNEKEILLDTWVEYRKQIRKPIKQATTEVIYKKMLEHTFEDCKFVINNSIENGWQGLFWDKIPVKQQYEIDPLVEYVNKQLGL